jgi:hypothetical protein
MGKIDPYVVGRAVPATAKEANLAHRNGSPFSAKLKTCRAVPDLRHPLMFDCFF